MSGAELPEFLAKFQDAEEELVMSHADKSEDSELYRQYYPKCKVTPEDLQRQHSPAEVMELALRTKLRVDMTRLNCLWDAKKRFNKKKRLDNRSERFINAMYVKAVAKKMVTPYTQEDVANYNIISKSWLKKENNIRLDRWKRQREGPASRASTSSESVSFDSFFNETEIPTSTSFVQPETPPTSTSCDQPETLPTSTSFVQPETPLTSKSCDQPETAPPRVLSLILSEPDMAIPDTAIPDMAIPESEELLPWGASKESETRPNNSKNSLDEHDWMQAALQISSQSLSLGHGSILQSQSQSQSQPVPSGSEDYNYFGTQVAAASTQENEL